MVFNTGNDGDYRTGSIGYPIVSELAGAIPMDIIVAQSIPTLAVAMIYCLWYRAEHYRRQQMKKLRERVAYMLWSATMEAD
jgi:hypothetical protein